MSFMISGAVKLMVHLKDIKFFPIFCIFIRLEKKSSAQVFGNRAGIVGSD